MPTTLVTLLDTTLERASAMTVEVQLQVAAIDLRDPAIQALIQDHLSDYAWSATSGLITMTVYSDGDVVADTALAIRCAQLRGIEVLRVCQERVTYGEIARRIGDFSREAVRKWTQATSFPAPRQANSGSARGVEQEWDWAEVLQWLKQHKGLDLGEELPTEKQVVEIDAIIHGVHDYASTAWHHVLAPAAPEGHVTVYRRVAAVTVSTADWNWVAPAVLHFPAASKASELDYA